MSCGPLSICALLLRTTLGAAQCSSDEERLTLLQFRICVDNCSECVVEDFTLRLCLERLFLNECDGCICPPSRRSATFSVYASPPFAERPTFDGDECDEPSLPDVDAAAEDLAAPFFDGVTCKSLLRKPIALLPGRSCFVAVMRDCALFRKPFLKIYDARVTADGTLSCPARSPTRTAALRCRTRCRVCPHKVRKCCLVRGEQLPQEQTTELGAVVPFAAAAGAQPFGVLFVTEAGGGTGASFASALTMAQALAAAQDGDEIWVQAGTYAGAFTLDRRVRVYGGFQTLTDVSRCQRDANPETNNTALVGLAGQDVVAVAPGATRTATLLDGFAIRHANNETGSGVFMQAGTGMTLRNVEISGHRNNNGAGIRAPGANTDLLLCGVAFRNNTATNIFGSAINMGAAGVQQARRLYALNVTFDGNTASAGAGSSIVNIAEEVDATFVNAVFTNNTVNTPTFGGVLLITGFDADAIVSIVNATFAENRNTNASGMAASVWARQSGGAAARVSLSIQNSILWNNTAANAPEEIYVDEQTPGSVTFTLENALIGGYPTSVGGNVAPAVVGTTPVKTADPLFVSPPADVRLQDGSPAIDCGNVSLVPRGVVLDLDRFPRVRGGAVDLGAYESHCTGASGGT